MSSSDAIVASQAISTLKVDPLSSAFQAWCGSHFARTSVGSSICNCHMTGDIIMMQADALGHLMADPRVSFRNF